jgi:hypothetical protein
MKNPLKQDSRRIIWFLLLATVLGHDAHAQQNTITGYNQIVGQWDASQAARTNNSRTGTGSPVGRDGCLRAGESYFQTDATAGQNNWYCVVTGYRGSWINSLGIVTVGSSLPATCTVGQPTWVVWDFQKENNVSSNSPTLLWYNGNGTSYPTSIGATGAGVANTDLSWDLTVSMTNGSTVGTVAFQGYSDGTHQLTVLAGSFCTQQ